MPLVRRPTSLRQALAGGWTCRGCAVELDRVGRPLDEYPPPGPHWYWTQTMRGAVGMLVLAFVWIVLACFSIWAVVAFPELARWWWWIAAGGLVIMAVPTIVICTMSVYAHRGQRLPSRDVS